MWSPTAFGPQVAYLEEGDFDSEGKLLVGGGKPAIVMFQGQFCGHCTEAKPAFQQLAENFPQLLIATVQVDGTRPSEQTLSHRLDQLFQRWGREFQGVPTYLFFGAQGQFLGEFPRRDLASLSELAQKLLTPTPPSPPRHGDEDRFMTLSSYEQANFVRPRPNRD